MTKLKKPELKTPISNTVFDNDLFDFSSQRDDNIDLSIIIPVFHNANFTQLALDGLTKLSNRYEIIVVDNASYDELSENAEIVDYFVMNTPKDRASVAYIGCPRNCGFGSANNKGYKSSRGRNIMFLNNDIRIEGDFETWPEEMIKLAEEGHLVGTLGGLLNSKFDFVKEAVDMPQTDYWYLSGWCMCASRETFDKLILNHYCNSEDQIVEGKAWGPWNEKFFLYFEDGDLTWRAKKLGIECKEIGIPVHHFGRTTGRKYNMFGHFKKSRKIFKNEWKEKYRA